jgi:anti-sigma-K factor RskA
VPHADPEVLALRALGENAGSAAEEEHIVGCADCRAELARLTEVVGIARQDGSPAPLDQPPAHLWDRIAAEAGGGADSPEPTAGPADEPADGPTPRPTPWPPAETTVPPGSGEKATRRPSPRRRMRVRLAIAAAAGIVIGAGAVAGVGQLASAPAPAAQALAQVHLRPLPQFPQWQGASGTAVMWSSSAALALDVTLRAPARPGFYEVWLLGRDGVSMISLGDLSASHTGSFTIPPGTNLRFYSRIDISLQAFNGSTVHSKVSVVRGSLPAAISGSPS